MTPRLLRAWRATSYEAGGVTVRIGQRSGAVDALLRRLGARQGAVLGAWNPQGRRRSAGLNHRAQARLAAASRRLPGVEGRGSHRGWSEDHLLLAVDPRRATVLARRFRQAGLVLLLRGAPARLVLLRHG
jgi:hypothetical protein